jgi:predicted flap endonuclease-1-like 5' DNA nuclease
VSKLSIIKIVEESDEAKLESVGVKSLEALLETCATKKGRTELSKKTEISEDLILKWANYADLARIKGVAGEYSQLLEETGVDTIPELATRNAKNLFNKMQEINEAKSIVKKLPTEAQVEDWIKQAASLPRILQY